MAKPTVTSSPVMANPGTANRVPWIAAGLVALGLLAGCGRPAPEGEAQGAAPDPAAEGVTQPSVVADDTSATAPTTPSSVATGDDQMDDQMTASAQVGDSAQTEGQIQSAAPVIITAGSLSGVVDQSPDRAGVRVTSNNPIVAAAPVIQTTTTTAVMTQAGTHVVQAGDTLSVIAETYGVPAKAIADANGMTDVGDTIKAGQELIIPAG